MSLTTAFNGALSGLQAFGKLSEAISSNVANATTPGYGKRTVSLSANEIGGGVNIVGTERSTEPAILAARRSAEAQFASAEMTAAFQSQLMSVLGTPDDSGSLSARLAAFEGSLIEAAAAPDAPARLDRAVFQAQDVVSVLNAAAETISDARSAADRSIASQVDQLNSALSDIQELNVQITLSRSRGLETASLMDQRQLIIDSVNEIVPLREIARPNGQVALMSEGGATLLDGTPAQIAFSTSSTVTPYQTVQSGTLSQLTVNGIPVPMESASSLLRGGTLAAQFTIRDVLAPQAQVELDAVARNLVERFQDTNVDPTLSTGQPGLFTDAGNAFDPVNELGIANRISISPAVDPTQNGESWRMRAGIGALVPGATGNADVLNAMRDALTDTRTIASGSLSQVASFERLVSELTSWAGSQSSRADARLSFVSATFAETQSAELSQGIDTDEQLQNLLLVEKAYAANARVLQTVDEMMDTLLGLG